MHERAERAGGPQAHLRGSYAYICAGAGRTGWRGREVLREARPEQRVLVPVGGEDDLQAVAADNPIAS